MSKKIVLAEKPSVAAIYAKVLNCDVKNNGYYEGKDYVCTWAVGHLFTLKEPHDYNEIYKTWNMDHLPIIPEKFQIKLIENVKSQFYIIKSLIDRPDIDTIINGGDCGIEGELIQKWIILSCKTNKPVKRLWIDDLTEKSIRNGFNNLKDSREFDSYFHAANTRTKIDWLYGISLSRAYTIKLSGRNIGVLSVGRCQTSVLNFIVQRDLEIESFKSVPYYKVVANLGPYKAMFINLQNKEDGTKIFDKNIAEKLNNDIKGKQGKVVNVKKEVKNKKPPKLFNLTDLQKIMSNKYNFTEDKTLTIAQKLYEEHKILSYPRTSSNYLSDNIADEFNDLIKALAFNKFSQIADKICNENIDKVRKDKAYVDNKMIEDHYALIPTFDVNEQKYAKLSDDEKILFDEIVLRFLSIFFDDYKYESTTIITNINEYPFISKCIVVINNGWKTIYKDDEEEEQQETIDKEINENDIFNVIDSTINSNKTKAPKCHTTASVLSAMQKYNIGTEATRSGIIGILLKREYVIRDGKKLISTQIGRDLIKSIAIEEIKSVEFTSELEKKMNMILKNQIDPEKVFNEAVENIKNYINLIKNSNIEVINKSENVLGKCPECGGNIIQKGKSDSHFYGCENYKSLNCRFSIPGNITPSQVSKLLNKNKTDLIKFKGSKGDFTARLTYNKESKKLEFIFDNKKKVTKV